MRILVESLKRLFDKGIVFVEKIDGMLVDGVITQEEYDYIVGMDA